MATYIPGITDYVPQIQPFHPDYNFLGNSLQTSQSRYDAAHKQINSVYGTILNSPMLREGDIKRRDEFFKAVDGDIKRISGLDLSLQQNVDQALTVFKPFYEDKNMMNDIALTKKGYAGLDKHERLKNCTDVEKCGGQAWEEMATEIKYKMDEYSKTSDKDALGFQMPDYTPYYDWQKDAVKLAATAGLSVSQDKLSGGWILKDENGALVQGGLYGLFKSTYGNDPRVKANYDTKAYVNKKNYIAGNIQTHGSEEAAESFYLNEQINQFNKVSSGVTEEVNEAVETTKARKLQLENQNKTIGNTESEAEILNRINGVVENLGKTQSDLETINNTVNSTTETKDLATLRRKGDFAAAQLLMYQGLGSMAEVMSHRGEKHTREVNPYAMEGLQQKNKKEMALFNYGIDKAKMEDETGVKMQLLDYEYGLQSGLMPSKGVKGMGVSGGATITVLPNEAYAIDKNVVPTAGLTKNAEEVARLQQESTSGNSNFLYNTFNKALLSAKNNDVGAIQYLKNTFGKSWNNIHTQAEMENAVKSTGRTLEGAFDYTLNTLDSTKNPYAKEWASDHMRSNKNVIQNLQLNNQTYYSAVKHNVGQSKQIVIDMLKESSTEGKSAYQDADLLLTPNGIPLIADEMPKDFAANYYTKHKNDPDWYSHAKEIYEPIRDKFVEKFNPAGIAGTNQTGANVTMHTNVNSKAVRDPSNLNAKAILNTLVPDDNSYVAVIGKPTEEALSAGDMEILKPYIMQFTNKINSPSEKNVTYNFAEAKTAAGDKNKSAIQVFLDPEIIKDAVGNKTTQGPLYAYKDVLAQGISLIYDNTVVKTPTTELTKTSNFVLNAKYNGIPLTQYPHTLKDAKYTYNQSKGTFDFTGTMMSYENGQKQYKPIHIPNISEGEVENHYNKSIPYFSTLEDKNVSADRQIAYINKTANTK